PCEHLRLRHRRHRPRVRDHRRPGIQLGGRDRSRAAQDQEGAAVEPSADQRHRNDRDRRAVGGLSRRRQRRSFRDSHLPCCRRERHPRDHRQADFARTGTVHARVRSVRLPDTCRSSTGDLARRGVSAPVLQPRDDGPLARALPWLVVLFALVAWLGRVDLLTPDEARHAEIAREMFLEGNWLAPRIYGEPYYDKPALFYWLTGASLWLFGQSSWAARLPSVAGALFSTVMTSIWVRAAWGTGAARWTTLMMGSTLFFIAVGRYVVIDMLLTASLTGALA